MTNWVSSHRGDLLIPLCECVSLECVSLDDLLKWWKSRLWGGRRIISQSQSTICPGAGAHPRALLGQPAKIVQQQTAGIERRTKGLMAKPMFLNPEPQTFSDMEDEEGKGEEDVTEKTQLVDEDVEKTEGWPGDTIEKEPEAGGRKTGSGQRSVAFHLGEEQLGQTVGGREVDGGEGRSDIGEEGGLANSEKLQRKESIGTSVKKEIIGILKPPNPRKELKSFPSLPECFLHDLGLIENIALE